MIGNCDYCLPRAPVAVEPGYDRATGRHVYVCERVACRVRAIMIDIEAQWPRLYAEIKSIDWKVESALPGALRKKFGHVA